MTVQELQLRFAYNRWANQRLVAAASLLPAEDRTRDLRASFGSVQGTLLHVLSGERRWLRFWQDGSLAPPLEPADCPTLEALTTAWTAVEQEQQTFLADVTEDLLRAERVVGGQTYRLGDLVQHLLNHSTYHRGQVAVLLRQLGHQPPATDYRLFLAERREWRLPNQAVEADGRAQSGASQGA
jgi:uncharacterized damage-inducible protein DinB